MSSLLLRQVASRANLGTRSLRSTKSVVIEPNSIPNPNIMEQQSVPLNVELLASTHGFNNEFVEYKVATRRISDLEILSAELLENLQHLNCSVDLLETMAPPVLEEEKRVKTRSSGNRKDKQRTTKRSPPDSRVQVLIEVPSDSLALTSGPSLITSCAPESASPDQLFTRAREVNARQARSLHKRGIRVTSKASNKSGSKEQPLDAMTHLMKKTGSVGLLNWENEEGLAAAVKDLLYVEKVKRNLRNILRRNPTLEEWSKTLSIDVKTLVARHKVGQQAKCMMLKANHRLVISVAKRYQNKGIALQDLISEGMHGLLKGVEKFDATKGFRFSTYAHWWIRQAITRSLSDQSRIVRLPTHLYEVYAKIRNAKSDFSTDFGREPSMAELSERVKLSQERITEVLNLALPVSSLDLTIGEEDGMDTVKDTLKDERTTPDEALEEMMLRKDLISIIDELDEREAGVIKLRYGLGTEKEMTLGEIGLHFNMSRERTRQIESKAISKLKYKKKSFESILQDYKNMNDDMELAVRNSQGTNKSK